MVLKGYTTPFISNNFLFGNLLLSEDFFLSIKETDAGEYMCFASNTVGMSVETFTLFVLGKKTKDTQVLFIFHSYLMSHFLNFASPN